MTTTPRPWTFKVRQVVDSSAPGRWLPHTLKDIEGLLTDASGRVVDLDASQVKRLIVQAVNTFDEAKAALIDAISYFEDSEILLTKRDHIDLSDSLRIGKQRAKAVLAKLEDPHA